jgi:hypothetical protein
VCCWSLLVPLSSSFGGCIVCTSVIYRYCYPLNFSFDHYIVCPSLIYHFCFTPFALFGPPPIRLKADEYYTTDGRWRHTNTIFTTTQFCSRLRKNRIKQYCKKKKNNNHLHLNYVLFYCTQLILSPITMWVRTSFMARCTRYNIVW